MNVKDVMMIGRKRTSDAWTVASTRLRPAALPSSAISTMRKVKGVLRMTGRVNVTT